MRLDAHQHFWRYDPAEHTWMSEQMTALKRDFLPPDIQPLLTAAGFEGCIAVQARQSLQETEWLLQLAEQHESIRGVVGWVDLCSDGITAQLEPLVGNSRLVGVRHVVHDEPDDEFMQRSDFRNGIARLHEYDLTYDLLLFPKHLPGAFDLARSFPRQRFVLDHLGKPEIAAGRLSPWRESIEALASVPNVECKLSGMVTEAHWKQWSASDFDPFLDVVLRAFGAERLMIGSDWPVCTLSGEYQPTMRIALDYIARLSTSEQAAILGKNCARFYRIGLR